MIARPGTWLAALVVLLALVCSLDAFAQGKPQLQLQLEADTIGVGDVVHVQLGAQSSDGQPTEARLELPAGLIQRGQPSTSPTQTHININGNQMDRWGLTVDWAVQAQRVGVFTIGPASVVVGGTRFAVRGATLHVVPAGQAPLRQPPQQQAPSPFPFSPFDPWKGLIPGFGGQGFPQPDLGPPQPTPQQVTTDPKLALDAPRGALYFLHATVDKTSAVVGEQVTFSIYEYDDASDPSVEVQEDHEATTADFARQPLMRMDQNEGILAGYAAIGGRTWVVKLIQRWALFPLRAGDLVIGPKNEIVARPRSAAGPRTTETLTVHVTEPPAAGRPPGYALGDVGRFSLAAQVTPRDVDQGGAVGVHVELSGTGNVPSKIATPAREGIEWLTPEVHDQLGSIGHESFGGKRSFDYVVRLRRAGDVSLGELSLPFWDPDAKKYDVARASLGTVHVKPVANAPAASAGEPEETLPGLPPPVDKLEGEPARRAHLDDVPIFWLLGVASWPVAFGLAVGATRAGKRMSRAWSARRASPAAELKERLAAADVASEGSDARQVDAAVARALEAAAMAHAGVNVRGALGGEVAARLARAGVAEGAASRIADLLRECEMARFSPEGADVASARDRWVRARGAIRDLERRP
ncbi:MAG TPA: hypothetical protein VF765_31505 [Polyangiaceae bacterium]